MKIPSALACFTGDYLGELVHFDIKKLARIVRLGHRVTGVSRLRLPLNNLSSLHT